MGRDELGRFSEPSVLILTSLANGPKHGYALAQDVEQFSGVHLGPGTLYGALVRLEERGLIRAVESDDRRQPYELTGAGAEALRTRLVEMRTVARVGLSRLAPT